jgi:hypothetical protein
MNTYLFTPSLTTAIANGEVANNMDYTGFDPSIASLNWNGSSGAIIYVNGTFGTTTDFTPFQAYADLADSIVEAQNNPVLYYFTQEETYGGVPYSIGGLYTSTTVGHPQPPNTTEIVPPVPSPGQTLQWGGSDWVVASFDITLNLPQAQASLVQTVTLGGAAAVNAEVGLYSTVQQIQAPTVGDLDALSYPGTTIGEYQSYVDGVISSATSTINSAEDVSALYSFNPADLPFIPAASGTIFTGRGGGLGPLDLNPSYYSGWNSTTVAETDTELFVPSTSTVIPYNASLPDPYVFDSSGNCFTTGNYTVQIRQVSTGFVLAQFECPLNPAGQNVEF